MFSREKGEAKPLFAEDSQPSWWKPVVCGIGRVTPGHFGDHESGRGCPSYHRPECKGPRSWAILKEGATFPGPQALLPKFGMPCSLAASAAALVLESCKENTFLSSYRAGNHSHSLEIEWTDPIEITEHFRETPGGSQVTLGFYLLLHISNTHLKLNLLRNQMFNSLSIVLKSQFFSISLISVSKKKHPQLEVQVRELSEPLISSHALSTYISKFSSLYPWDVHL